MANALFSGSLPIEETSIVPTRRSSRAGSLSFVRRISRAGSGSQPTPSSVVHLPFMSEAVAEACTALSEGGIPDRMCPRATRSNRCTWTRSSRSTSIESVSCWNGLLRSRRTTVGSILRENAPCTQRFRHVQSRRVRSDSWAFLAWWLAITKCHTVMKHCFERVICKWTCWSFRSRERYWKLTSGRIQLPGMNTVFIIELEICTSSRIE